MKPAIQRAMPHWPEAAFEALLSSPASPACRQPGAVAATVPAAVLASLLAAATVPVLAQAPQLKPPAERISDAAIQADHQAYEALQGRIQALNDNGGRPLRNYHLSKAQCWLDVSFHEYSRNDRSAFPQAAMTESEKLIQGMEKPSGVLPMDTPLVNGGARLRPDLWARAAALKAHAGFACAQHKLACAEVELVHAGHEYNQHHWRHAKPYVQIAEDLLGEADRLAQACPLPNQRGELLIKAGQP